jgi:uncharacterized protein (TIGR02391 family)
MAYQTIHSLLPDADALLALDPEELAGVVLEHLLSIPSSHGDINRYNFSLVSTYSEYPPNKHEDIARALMEAWVWLEREGFLAPKPGDTGMWSFITRRGRQIGNAVGVAAYRASALLPKKQLHPSIAQKCTSAFLRGEYDTAVFQAFKELEVAIRMVGNFKAEDYGVDMVRKAFRPNDGPLTEKLAPVAEQEALANLMAGAIGSYKNPHSHRNVALEAHEAAEMIILASHLLGIVHLRSKNCE